MLENSHDRRCSFAGSSYLVGLHLALAFILIVELILCVPSLLGEEEIAPPPSTGLQGDIDGSGVVDRADELLMEKALGSNSTDPDWDARCDLDGDGLVSFKDFDILKSNMGKSVPGLQLEVSECGYPSPALMPSLIPGGKSPGEDLEARVILQFQLSLEGSIISIRSLFSDLDGPDTELVLS
ncbi:MAG: hypothetical protein JW941_08870, partial [Candidatus Coatesbacteria bacterium]|nr:hypothetical protein [Candidatus Coatesbacteria bacterium]